MYSVNAKINIPMIYIRNRKRKREIFPYKIFLQICTKLWPPIPSEFPFNLYYNDMQNCTHNSVKQIFLTGPNASVALKKLWTRIIVDGSSKYNYTYTHQDNWKHMNSFSIKKEIHLSNRYAHNFKNQEN